MDIEAYARRHPQLAYGDVEAHLVEWLGKGGFESLLDVGCGNGRIISALLEEGLIDGARVHAVDLSQSNIERLRAGLPTVDARVDDAETLATVPDGEVDFLFSTQVLEHVDDARMLGAIRRVLSADGTAYISTVFRRPWARFIWRNERGEWCLDPTHVREYTDDTQLLGLLPAAGLELVDSRKMPVSYAGLDVFARWGRLDPERIYASTAARALRRVRVPIPGYFTWSLVLRPVAGLQSG